MVNQVLFQVGRSDKFVGAFWADERSDIGFLHVMFGYAVIYQFRARFEVRFANFTSKTGCSLGFCSGVCDFFVVACREAVVVI